MPLRFSFLFTTHLTTDYMRQNTASFMYSTRADCCEEHYPYIYDECMGISKVPVDKWYPDWSPGMPSEDTCKKDGNAPTYMVLNPSKLIAALVSFVNSVHHFNVQPLSVTRSYVDARYVI